MFFFRHKVENAQEHKNFCLDAAGLIEVLNLRFWDETSKISEKSIKMNKHRTWFYIMEEM